MYIYVCMYVWNGTERYVMLCYVMWCMYVHMYRERTKHIAWLKYNKNHNLTIAETQGTIWGYLGMFPRILTIIPVTSQPEVIVIHVWKTVGFQHLRTVDIVQTVDIYICKCVCIYIYVYVYIYMYVLFKQIFWTKRWEVSVRCGLWGAQKPPAQQ